MWNKSRSYHSNRLADRIAQATNWIYSRQEHVVYGLEPGGLREVTPRAPFEFRRALDLLCGPHLAPMAKVGFLDSDDLRRAAVLGDICFTATVEGRVVAFCRVARHERVIPELDHRMRIEPKQAWIYACATDPEYRNRGFYSSMLSRIATELFDQGCRRIWIDVEPWNAASIRGINRVGFTPHSKLVRRTWFGIGRTRRVSLDGRQPV